MMAPVSAMGGGPSCKNVQIDPAFLRSRAWFYRDLADEETDNEKAELYREVADAFDRDADALDSDTSS
jgi:hypothetical protein